MSKKDCEGQITLFGTEPFDPKKAAGTDQPEIELDTEFEDFLSVGKKRRKPKEDAVPEKQSKSEGTAVEANENEEPDQPDWEHMIHMSQGELHAVMQKSFCTEDGRKATVAYVDYNSVYTMDFEGKISFLQYPDSRRAVDEYLKQMEDFANEPGAKESKEHPRFEKAEKWNAV